VIDVDLAKFFDTIDQTLLVEMLSKKIGDRKLLRYVQRMFKSGVLRRDELSVNDEGVAQGSLCSPILANIFAHYVIDEWFEETVKPHCASNVAMFRYADDMVICCGSAHDGYRIRQALERRLTKYHLALNADKTRLVDFRRPGLGSRRGRAFDFLGFTFHWGKSRAGNDIVKLKTSGTRLRSKLKRVNVWAREVRSRYPLRRIWATFCAKLRGHIQYYGVSFNSRAVQAFVWRAVRIMFKWLNRRSQKRSFNWEQFTLFLATYPPPTARVHHRLF